MKTSTVTKIKQEINFLNSLFTKQRVMVRRNGDIVKISIRHTKATPALELHGFETITFPGLGSHAQLEVKVISDILSEFCSLTNIEQDWT